MTPRVGIVIFVVAAFGLVVIFSPGQPSPDAQFFKRCCCDGDAGPAGKDVRSFTFHLPNGSVPSTHVLMTVPANKVLILTDAIWTTYGADSGVIEFYEGSIDGVRKGIIPKVGNISERQYTFKSGIVFGPETNAVLHTSFYVQGSYPFDVMVIGYLADAF